ncbi:hypothetical protein V062_02662 [Staphylococcus aureus R0357]|nr:hypothetical protein V060_02673 [Staphylococcus aureus R0294]EZY60545.1 hypothetical protein V061_02709 [Staphylococcus aureus R0353]EZY63319.1 hypothetical protein V062_02662 [Staphylococcus aureus R0357]EZY68285.1 hypothetical protein V064_02672 [Staphylococcus aureus R0545]EZY69314.1 hypothetical protein V063_02471 [Staphylococcus aureus R0487]EZY71137.1 hypothetical protein V065_02649 [Staphylococcus aureus R0611]EZY76844.1 hypothetical protein V066_02635 [Staphylococcus aureus R0615]
MIKYLVIFLDIIFFSLLTFILFIFLTHFYIELVDRRLLDFNVTLTDSDCSLLRILSFILLLLGSVSCALRH